MIVTSQDIYDRTMEDAQRARTDAAATKAMTNAIAKANKLKEKAITKAAKDAARAAKVRR